MRVGLQLAAGISISLGLMFASLENAFAKISMSNVTRQGETIEIEFWSEEPELKEKPEIVFNGHSYPLFQAVDHDGAQIWRGLLTIPADLNPGIYKTKVGDQELSMTVNDAKFPVQRISLPKSKDNFEMSPGEKEAIEGAKAVVSADRLWQGKFEAPCNSRQSARFGMKRIVNGRLLKDYFHTGLDFAAPLGKPVHTCAAGRVVLARKGLKLHGNTVAIDHGQGVVSIYIHLQQINVKEGQLVAMGDQIGTVGQSGRATGPHLHFGIYVNQTASNPSQWLTTIF